MIATPENLRELKHQGFTYPQIAAGLGVSRQRAQQIIDGASSTVRIGGGFCNDCGAHTKVLHRHTLDYRYNTVRLICESCHGKVSGLSGARPLRRALPQLKRPFRLDSRDEIDGEAHALYVLRMRLGIKTGAVAFRMNSSTQYVGGLERGRKQWSSKMVVRYRAALQQILAEFIEGLSSPPYDSPTGGRRRATRKVTR